MKQTPYLVVLLLVGLLLGAGCGPRAGQVAPTSFEQLAGRVPAGTEQAFFIDLKPDGELGRTWHSFQERLAKTEWGQESLRSMLAEFKVDEFGLQEVAVGPAVSGFTGRANYAIVQVGDAQAAVEAMHDPAVSVAWQQEIVDGQELYHGRGSNGYGSPRGIAWTVRDDLLYVVSVYDGEPLPELQALLAVDQSGSLAARPGWQMLRDRFANGAVAVMFLIPPPASGTAPPPAEMARVDLLSRNMEAAALSLVPHDDALEVQIDGVMAPGADEVPEIRALYDLPAADPTGWASLPASSAVVLISHDASTVWPWSRDLLGLNVRDLDTLRQGTGLDVQADLWGPDGPLTGPFAMAVLPPEPEQPTSAGLPAAQVLFVAPEAGTRDAERLRASMEERGAIFGPVSLDGLALQQQVGTGASGYALSYALDRGILYLGSSPVVVARAAASHREGGGLVEDEIMRRLAGAMPAAPFIFAYAGGSPLRELIMANTTGDTGGSGPDPLDSLEAMAMGLRLSGQELRGKVYFLLADD